MRKFYFILLFLLLTSVAWTQAQILAPLPAQTGTFAGNVRGYWFVAPTCFTITGVEVPTTASSGAQSVAVMRFQANPPLFSATTNVFTTLLLAQNSAIPGIIPCNIQVEQGDVIGFLGSRAGVNSYGGANFVSSIEGLPVTFARLGMQFPLATTAPTQLWTEAGGSLSRVNMYYDSVITYNITATPSGPNSFTFADGSDSSFTSVWNYGDGSPLDNVWQGNHTYATGGTYTVCSYITNSCGTDTVCTTVSVCGVGPTSSFAYFSNGLTPSFTNLSTGGATSYAWDFGDGGTSTAANPTHTYAAPGAYTVCLVSTDACAVSDTMCLGILVCNLPTSAFTALGSGLSETFTNASTNAQSYWWDFGDGTNDTTANPTHVYTTDGSYTVCLITTNLCGSDTSCTVIDICLVALTANFSFTSNQFTIACSDLSTGASTYSWNFGDGGTSTVASPTHTYAQNGTYVICLTVTNNCGASITTCDTTVINIIGVTNALPGFEVSIAPNPMSQRTTILVSNSGLPSAFTLELLDMRGALVLSRNGQVNEPLILEKSSLAQGMYSFRILQGGISLGSGKLIVE